MQWFTSDEHFFHQNIIKYCQRPFANVQEMNRAIIYNFNSLVKPEDVVYHIGDFMWWHFGAGEAEKILGKLNGTHILIFGNHDRFEPMKYVDIGFQSAHTSLIIDVADRKVVLCHDPATATVAKSMLWICGHAHGLFKQVGNVVNVGVDVWDFKPVPETEIIKAAKGEKI